MKECEKYLKEFDLEPIDNAIYAFRDGWKAALKWVLSQQSEYEGRLPQDNFNYIDTLYIEEELEE